MANREHLVILLSDVDDWNEWRSKNPDVLPELNDAILTRAYLSASNLSRVDLSKAYLWGADLRGLI